MKIRKMKGKALALFAVALMGAAGTVAAIPPRGTCTAANQGEYRTETNFDGSSRVYLCDDNFWQTYAICDKYHRCTIVI
ncbi:hypothetical protein A7A76_13690 [Lysobacter enzymogenes]|uniref:hypothetical protein n=1 Tax=Lysobacter enzymogenes TaxID=69 RepID=UPI0019D0423A|nr:hypothetical protein [Lysobacter enzymogenes]MBN7135774.1 hypothetical protein [Lysobacter enzymogenes]